MEEEWEVFTNVDWVFIGDGTLTLKVTLDGTMEEMIDHANMVAKKLNRPLGMQSTKQEK